MAMQQLWPYLVILIAGLVATDLWRWLGVVAGNRLDEGSELLIWVKSSATALVAGVIAKQMLYPGGVLAESPMALRIGAAAVGFMVFLLAGKKMLPGIVTALGILAGGLYFLGF